MGRKKTVQLRNFAVMLFLLSLSTGVGLLFVRWGLSQVNIIPMYILGVLITSVFTASKWWSTISSLCGVLIFNFFFTEPRYTFAANDPRYILTFLMTLVAGLLTTNLVIKTKAQAEQADRVSFRTKVLLETNQILQRAKDTKEIADATAYQIRKLLDRTVICYLPEEGELVESAFYPTADDEEGKEGYCGEEEREAARRAYKENRSSGAYTGTLNEVNCTYFTIRNEGTIYGVVGVRMKGMPLDDFERNMLLSILGESALAMEKELYSRKREEEATRAKNEQLRANLLRSISHDLRTPLTSISGNAAILRNSEDVLDKEKKQSLYTDIYDDAIWLISLVENLLAVTRIENGTMLLHTQVELLDEIIVEALKHVNRKKEEHEITFAPSDEVLLVKVDSRLLVQVLINLIDNAIKYTQEGSHIVIRTGKIEEQIQIIVEDDGPGISDAAKAKIFEMFYTAGDKAADSRRGLGLGLFLCKSIMTAHDGAIYVEDNEPRGTRFVLTLKAEEVILNE